MTRLRGSLVGRMLLWAAVLFALSLPVLWSLFSAAVDQISAEVVDTQIREQGNQLRGYWASAAVSGGVGDQEARPSTALPFAEVDADRVWQISVDGKVAYRSPFLRLVDATIPPKVTAPTSAFVLQTRDTPIGRLRVAERLVREARPVFPGGPTTQGSTVLVHYLVGLREDRYRDMVEEHAQRLRQLAIVVALPVSLVLLAFLGGLVLILRRNLNLVDTAMVRFEDGSTDRIEGRFPAELQALVDRMNGLLDHNHALVERTRKYVTKIAHDLNHPLSVLRNGLGRAGETALMLRQVERMRGLIDRYTSLARAIGPEGSFGAPVALAPLLDDIREGLSIVYRPQPVAIEVDCPAGLSCPAARQDLEAVLSNLAGNAHKFAAARMRLSAADDGEAVLVAVDDDGPGIPPADRDSVFHWGQRLDEAPPGTGFGLSIVRDIADLYGGTVTLGESDLGGLRAEVRLPKRRTVAS